MSPAKLNREEQEKRAINGTRPTPLRIKKDSQVMKKPSLFPHNKTRGSDYSPVIIYAHSPEIIHTKPRDFMGLVQKLTGLSRPQEVTDNEKKPAGIEHSNGSSSSISTDENSSSSHQFLADMPLFTPNSTNLFLSPLPMCRYGDTVSFSPSPNMGSSISPSVFAVKNEFPKF